MARYWEVYPKAEIRPSGVWAYRLTIAEQDATGVPVAVPVMISRDIPTATTVTRGVLLLKVVFTLTTDDTAEAADIDDALYVDDIKPGGGYETVWGNWQEQAESIIARLASGFTVREFWEKWRQRDTAAMRNDARRALVTQRGWTVTGVHQHEGDGTVTEESS